MAAHGAGSGAPYRAPRRTRTTGDIINDVLAIIARLAAVAFVLALAYLLYGTFRGSFQQFPQGYTRTLAAQVSSNVFIAGRVEVVSATVFTVCMILLLWGWEMAGPIFLVGGLLFYAGLPYLGVPYLSAVAMDPARKFHPGVDLVEGWRLTGGVFFVGAAIFLFGWAQERLRLSLSAPRRTGGLKVPFYTACWQSHYCKNEVKRFCAPGMHGFRKSCWRFKSGCFCDESIGDRLLLSGKASGDKDLRQFLGTPAKAPAPTFGDHFQSTHHRVLHQKIACADCPLYNYHEVQKHRILAPILILAVPGLMYYFTESLHAGYVRMLSALDRFALHLAFDPKSTAGLQGQIHSALGVPLVEWLVFALIAMTLITMVARALEYWCFTLKL